MTAYAPCAQCHCLVKAEDRECPFCGATMSSACAATRTEIGGGAPRMSRAAWLAVASSVAGFAALGTACLSGATADVAADTDAGDAQPPPDPACAIPDAGTFACGDASCDVATGFCARSVAEREACQADRASHDEHPACSTRQTSDTFPKQCLACPTCKCIVAHFPKNDGIRLPGYPYTEWSCDPLPAGGVQITQKTGQTCGACYGAPPSRLERIARDDARVV
jgi:hypothetical protein